MERKRQLWRWSGRDVIRRVALVLGCFGLLVATANLTAYSLNVNNGLTELLRHAFPIASLQHTPTIMPDYDRGDVIRLAFAFFMFMSAIALLYLLIASGELCKSAELSEVC
jgi:hypothetical protein